MTESWRPGLIQRHGLIIERVAIRKPVWSSSEVGIATFRAMRSNLVEVKVMYRRKGGEELIPTVLWMPSDKILTYPKKAVRLNVEVCMIPIEDMNIKGGCV